MDQPVLNDLYDKINAIAINVATLTAKYDEKENRCEEHQKKMDDHDLRIRSLELVSSASSGSSTASHSWRETLMQAFTLAATVAATVIAIRNG